ncbi:MAG: hypothetical protein KF776_06905 [Burkholderiales bacterium]|nr:hypothetical protein [Burkholderiales bacterium]
MERTEVLLAEYSEAGQGCRAQEQYVRTTLHMYLTLSAALSAFLVSVAIPPMVKAYVCLAAFGVGVCMTLLVLRHRKIYGALADRAREIEDELKISLHTQVKAKVSSSGDPSAKTMSAFIIGLIAAGFLVAAFLIACGS